MKTTNNAQKTENRKFKNLITKTVVVLGAVFFSLSLSASQTVMQVQENNTEKTERMTSARNKPELLASATTATIASRSFFIELSKEKKMEIESWMIDESYFVSKAFIDLISSEAATEIESWMIDNFYFEVQVIATDDEPAPEVEAWMIHGAYWER